MTLTGPCGYVYFMYAPELDAVKIGFAGDPWKRLKELQTGCPEVLNVYGVLPGHIEREGWMHDAFSQYKLRGEWYKVAGQLKDCLERGCVYRSQENVPPLIRDDLWQQYIEAAPVLLEIERDAERMLPVDALGMCMTRLFYAAGCGFKTRVSGVVGWDRTRWAGEVDQHPELRTEQAYDVVYERIWRLLPPCPRTCGGCSL